MDEDVRKLVEENLKLTREVHTMVVKVRRYMAVRTFFSFIYLLLIIGPILFAILYLPPLIAPYWQQYKDIMGTWQQVSNSQQVPANGGAGLSIPQLLQIANDLGVPVTNGRYQPTR